MNNIAKICLVVVISSLMSVGIVKALSVGSGTLEVDSLKVGRQGEGGVTYFNGTLINETTDSEGNGVPVTYGDDVRIDGSVWRGAVRGTGDTSPFKIDDNLEVSGSISFDGGQDLGDTIDELGETILYNRDLVTDTLGETILENRDLIIENRELSIDNYDFMTGTAWDVAGQNRNSAIAMAGMLTCLASAAAINPSYIPTSTWVSCWNDNMSGTPVLVPLSEASSNKEITESLKQSTLGDI